MKYLLTLLVLFAATACTSNRYRYAFDPSPAEVQIAPESGAANARALVTVLQGERESSFGGTPFMHLRLRVENSGTSPIRIAPDSFVLVGSELEEFGPAQVEQPVGDIATGQDMTYDVRFEFPPGLSLSAPTLDGLNFHWRIDYAEGSAEVSTTFQRRIDTSYYYDPYYGYPYYPSRISWSIGYGYYCR